MAGEVVKLEQAKSGRSTCRATGDAIAKGEWRVGFETWISGRVAMAWMVSGALLLRIACTHHHHHRGGLAARRTCTPFACDPVHAAPAAHPCAMLLPCWHPLRRSRCHFWRAAAAWSTHCRPEAPRVPASQLVGAGRPGWCLPLLSSHQASCLLRRRGVCHWWHLSLAAWCLHSARFLRLHCQSQRTSLTAAPALVRSPSGCPCRPQVCAGRAPLCADRRRPSKEVLPVPARCGR